MTPRSDRASWRSLAARIRFITVTLGVLLTVGWVSWFYPFDDLLDRNGTPLGADFSMFYVAGQMAADGELEQLYDQAAHQQRLQSLFPSIDPQFCLPYRYPPLVAATASRLARLPYEIAFSSFFAISTLAFGTSILLWRRTFSWLRDGRGSILIWVAAGWPVILETLIGGQASLITVLICTVTIYFLHRGKTTAAGACLALALLKPNVLLIFAAGATVYRPSLLRGAIPTACGLLAVTCWWAGWPVLVDYFGATSNLAAGNWDVETPFWKIHSLSTWWALLLPGHRLLSAAVGCALASAVGYRMRGVPQAFPLGVGLLIVLNAAFNPYTPIYDLSLLAVAGICAAQYYFVDSDSAGATARRVPSCLYFALAGLYFGPHVSQSLAKIGGLQFFPLLLLGAAAWLSTQLWRSTRPGGSIEAEKPASSLAASG